MSAPPTTYDLLETLGDLCNGTLDAERGAWLNRLLETDPQARTLYANYLTLHACLAAEGGDLDDRPGYDRLSETAPLIDEGNAAPNPWRTALLPSTNVASSNSHASAPARRRWSWALAASLLLTALGASWLTWWATSAIRMAGADRANDPARGVARVTGTHNCVWDTAAGLVAFGDHLCAGQRVELLEGLAEITFNDGATVLLEGPASFVIDAPDRAALTSGRLAAFVPKRAQGFRLHTPTLDVFEVGAEFGLLAQESGAAELHVFNGLVKADVLDPQGHAWQRLQLNASEAARVNPRATTVVEFPAEDAKFVRSMLPSSGPHDGLLAYDGFRYPEGPLSAQNGGFGWAGPWFIISADEDQGDSNAVLPGSLTHENVVPAGNRAAITAQRNRIRRSLATSVGGVFDSAGLVENQDGVRLVGRDGNVIYLSFLQRVSAVDDGFYGVELHRGDGNPNRVLCIGNGADGTGYGATSNVNIYGKDNFPALGDENQDVNLFVIKIRYGVGNRDIVEVFRNPESLRDEQANVPTATLTGNFAFDRISLANFDGSKHMEVDELRVGTHFLAVTGRWGARPGSLLRRITALPSPAAEPRLATVAGACAWRPSAR
jgi:hypothetical protein